MQIKRYEADDVQTAMAQVKEELGDAAVVLQTRQLKGRGLLGLGGGARVEVVVALDRPSPADGRRGANGDRRRNGQLGADLHAEIRALRAELSALRGRLGDPEGERAMRLMERAGLSPTTRAAVLASAPPDADEEELIATLAELIDCRPLDLDSDCPEVVALVGPTGAGKTTTIAKLAAHARLAARKSVALITVDTYRIGAVDQLRTFARLLDVPMEVVLSVPEMRAACQKFADTDLILVDTIGRSPADERQIGGQAITLAASNPTDVLLTVSAPSSYTTLHAALNGFAVASPTRLVLTKMDESPRLGEAVSFLAEAALPLAYTTHGQDVPHDIAPGDAIDLARRAFEVGP